MMPVPKRLGEQQQITRACRVVAYVLTWHHRAGHCHAVLGLLVVQRVTAHNEDAGLLGLGGAALQDFAKDVH